MSPICANPKCSNAVDFYRPLPPGRGRKYCRPQCNKATLHLTNYKPKLRTPQPCGNPECDQLVQPPKRGRTAKFCSNRCAHPDRYAGSRSREPIDWTSIDGIRKECELVQLAAPELDHCWVWQRSRGKDGYARRGDTSVHRLVARLAYPDLGSEPIHHRCGQGARGCVSPNHLIPITQAENILEMHQRNWYERQIAALVAALTDICPWHSLLNEG